MFNRRLAAALAGLSLLASTGCGGPEEFQDPGPVGQGLTWEEFRAQVYQDSEGVFVFDGDVALHDENKLREFFDKHVKNGQLIVGTSGGVDVKWDDTQKLNLTYCVSSTGFSSVEYSATVQAMTDATAAWEAVANVNFTHRADQDASCTATNPNVLFDVRPAALDSAYWVRAFNPATPRGSRNVLINPVTFTSSFYPLVGLLRHELGHVLGFEHEHIRADYGPSIPEGCGENFFYRSLTSYDSASVMHYPECEGTGDLSLNLSALDAQGAASLYGAPGTTPPPPPPPPTETTSGTLTAGQSAYHGAYEVVAGTYFKVVMTGSGNPDLYVNFGSYPTATQYTCRPALSGASETCNVLVPAGQTRAYIMVTSVTNTTYSLALTYTKPTTTGPVTETANGSLSSGQYDYHGAYEVVPGTYFKVVMTGTGNPDLYVNFGSYPTLTSYYCRPALYGPSETCDVLVPAGHTKAYIMLKGSTSVATLLGNDTYSLEISYTKPSPSGPASATVTGSVVVGENDYHGVYDVAPGTYFKVVMTGTGNPNLYVNLGSYPSTTSYYCRPALSGASETCNVLVPAGVADKAYIMVRGGNTTSSSSTYKLDITYVRP